MFPTILALACAPAPPAPPAPPEPPPAPAPAPVTAGEPPRGNIGGEPILDRPVVLGAITTEAVEAGVGARQAAIRACYTGFQTSAASPPGKVLVKFTIAADGSVADAQVRSSSLRHGPIEDCVLAELAKASFPALQGGAKALVQYPFSFP